jgi:hypothetical protein
VFSQTVSTTLAPMQRALAILTVVLCAAQPNACQTRMYVQSVPLVDGPPANVIARPALGVTLIELPEAEAWRRVKSTLGTRVQVLQPTAMPQRFERSTVLLEYAFVAGDEIRYRIGYRAEGALVNFAAGAVNSAAPTSTSPVDVRGIAAQYSTTSSWPERQIVWTEGLTWSGDDLGAATAAIQYSLQARGVSEEELLLIARGLVAVP